MDEKVKLPEDKPTKPPAKKKKAEPVYLIDWKAAADGIEAELKKAGWDSVKQRRNPRFIFGLVARYIIRPLVMAINSQKGV